MAYLATGERPAAAALTDNPLVGFWRWLRRSGTSRRQRLALHALLQFDEHRLDDLGISRHDVIEALALPAGEASDLAARRARRARAWLRSA